jgi:hypothetical protein
MNHFYFVDREFGFVQGGGLVRARMYTPAGEVTKEDSTFDPTGFSCWHWKHFMRSSYRQCEEGSRQRQRGQEGEGANDIASRAVKGKRAYRNPQQPQRLFCRLGTCALNHREIHRRKRL